MYHVKNCLTAFIEDPVMRLQTVCRYSARHVMSKVLPGLLLLFKKLQLQRGATAAAAAAAAFLRPSKKNVLRTGVRLDRTLPK